MGGVSFGEGIDIERRKKAKENKVRLRKMFAYRNNRRLAKLVNLTKRPFCGKGLYKARKT
jgi:hypothetical protein